MYLHLTYVTVCMEFEFDITNDTKREILQDAVDRVPSASITISASSVQLEVESLGAVDSYWDVWRQLQSIRKSTDGVEKELADEIITEMNDKFDS